MYTKLYTYIDILYVYTCIKDNPVAYFIKVAFLNL